MDMEIFKFPTGETHCKIKTNGNCLFIPMNTYLNDKQNLNDYLMTVMMGANVYSRRGEMFSIFLPYLPYSRQDRPTSDAEPFSLKVIGVGGLLLQNHNRDEFGYSLKATHIVRHSTGSVNIYKDPITDPGKKSKCGFMKLDYCTDTKKFITIDQVTPEEEKTGLLQPVFRNGQVLKRYSLEQLRENIEKTRNLDAIKGLDYADSV